MLKSVVATETAEIGRVGLICRVSSAIREAIWKYARRTFFTIRLHRQSTRSRICTVRMKLGDAWEMRKKIHPCRHALKIASAGVRTRNSERGLNWPIALLCLVRFAKPAESSKSKLLWGKFRSGLGPHTIAAGCFFLSIGKLRFVPAKVHVPGTERVVGTLSRSAADDLKIRSRVDASPPYNLCETCRSKQTIR